MFLAYCSLFLLCVLLFSSLVSHHPTCKMSCTSTTTCTRFDAGLHHIIMNYVCEICSFISKFPISANRGRRNSYMYDGRLHVVMHLSSH